jgi:ElaA protein
MATGESDTAALRWQSSGFSELGTGPLYEILRLRQDVFIVEQNCPYRDLDDLDRQALHLSARRDGQLLAYLRALPPGASYPQSSLGRIVVSPEARGLRLGRELVERGVALNIETWPGAGICIGAQAHLEAFYNSLGFDRTSDVYDEDGIPHIKMLYREAP